MDWRLKAAVQGVLSRLPAAERSNSMLQRATGSYALSADKIPESVRYAREHLSNVDTFSEHDRSECAYFEFGAGWGLQGPIAMSLLGAGDQLVYDLYRHVRASFVQKTLDAHRASPAEDARRVSPAARDPWSALRAMRIDYRAPADARATGLPDASIDVATSTNTLEHIPVEDIARILDEMRRVLRRDGLISLQIDYNDHYSYADPSITPYNFLRYSPRAWNLANNALHFQNRLRHHQYLELLASSHFEVVHERVIEASDEDLTELRSLPIDAHFAGINPRALGIRGAFLVARPKR